MSISRLFSGYKDRIACAIAFKIPRSVAYWAAVRVGAHATQGPFRNESVPALPFMVALQRWAK